MTFPCTLLKVLPNIHYSKYFSIMKDLRIDRKKLYLLYKKLLAGLCIIIIYGGENSHNEMKVLIIYL